MNRSARPDVMAANALEPGGGAFRCLGVADMGWGRRRRRDGYPVRSAPAVVDHGRGRGEREPGDRAPDQPGAAEIERAIRTALVPSPQELGWVARLAIRLGWRPPEPDPDAVRSLARSAQTVGAATGREGAAESRDIVGWIGELRNESK